MFRLIINYPNYLLATLLLLSCGFGLGWSSPAIPKLFAADTPVPVTSDESSWIMSFMDVGYLLSAFPAAIIMDRYLFISSCF